MNNTEEYFINLLHTCEIKGMNELIEHLKNNQFFVSPASTKYHGSFKGGLLEHSVNVYRKFYEECILLNLLDTKIELRSIIISSLLHDLCKINMYKLNNFKKYVYNITHFGSHSSLSLNIIKKYIKLLPIEETLIMYHMGYYGTKEFNLEKGEYTLKELSEVQKDPLVKLFHWSDDYCTQFLEK
jgi:23S rRNA maturation-related 3'-5' exoribonuclease YhaM